MPRKPRQPAAAGEDAGDREPRRIKHSVSIRPDLLEQARDAAAHLAGHPEFLTMSKLVERGLEAELDRLRRKHNGGKPFPRRPTGIE